jgi:hypothetical protein
MIHAGLSTDSKHYEPNRWELTEWSVRCARENLGLG